MATLLEQEDYINTGSTKMFKTLGSLMFQVDEAKSRNPVDPRVKKETYQKIQLIELLVFMMILTGNLLLFLSVTLPPKTPPPLQKFPNFYIVQFRVQTQLRLQNTLIPDDQPAIQRHLLHLLSNEGKPPAQPPQAKRVQRLKCNHLDERQIQTHPLRVADLHAPPVQRLRRQKALRLQPAHWRGHLLPCKRLPPVALTRQIHLHGPCNSSHDEVEIG